MLNAGGQVDIIDRAARLCGHVTVDALPAGGVDVTDRAARLLGIIYGSVGQILQRGGTSDLIVQLRSAGAEIDPRSIRALTNADVVTADSLTKWGGTALTGRDISGDLRALIDDGVKGLMRSLGDAGAGPANVTGNTVLSLLAGLAARATTPVTYNVTMTNANTEYSQALPAGTKRYQMGTQDGTAWRLAFVTGKVAAPTTPWYQSLANEIYFEEGLYLAAQTLYFACGTAGKIMQIIAWT